MSGAKIAQLSTATIPLGARQVLDLQQGLPPAYL